MAADKESLIRQSALFGGLRGADICFLGDILHEGYVAAGTLLSKVARRRRSDSLSAEHAGHRETNPEYNDAALVAVRAGEQSSGVEGICGCSPQPSGLRARDVE